MNDPRTIALIKYRIVQADETLREAEALLGLRALRGSLNRSYYAMFYAVLALVNSLGQTTKKHSGALALFDRELVRTGVFDKQLSEWLHVAFKQRQKADYEDMAAVESSEAEEAFDHARQFVARVKTYLAGQIGE